MKKYSNWSYDEVLAMTPIDWEVFMMLELEDRKN